MDFWKKLLNNLGRLSLVKFLVSSRVAATLIGLVTFFSLLGMVIPQKFIYPPEFIENWSRDYPTLSRFAEATGMTNLFYSWWFLTLLFLVLLSLFFCTLLRLKPKEERSLKITSFQRALDLKRKPDIEVLKVFFARYFYRVEVESENEQTFWVFARRLDTRFFSILFHFGIMVILLAAVADKSSGLNGTVLLTEGETFVERHFDYETLFENPFFYENHQFFQVALERVAVNYQGNVLTDVEAKVRVVDNNFQKEELIKVNYPLSYKGFSFLIEKIGFSPLIDIKDTQGKTLFSAYVSLGKEKKQSFADFVRFSNYLLELELFPNKLNPRRLYLAEHPQLKLIVKEKGKVIWQGILNYGEVARTPAGFISFAGLNYWILFQVAYNPLLPLIFFGFYLTVSGLVIRLLFPSRTLVLRVKAKGRKWEVAFWGKTRLGKVALEKELKKIEDYLQKRYN